MYYYRGAMSSGIAAKVDVPHAWVREETMRKAKDIHRCSRSKKDMAMRDNPAMNKPVTEKFSEEKKTCIIYLSSQRGKKITLYFCQAKEKKNLHNIFVQPKKKKDFFFNITSIFLKLSIYTLFLTFQFD